MKFRVLDGSSFFARKCLARSKETRLQSSLCAIFPDRTCSSLTLLADARASRKAHLCVRYFKGAVSSGSYGSLMRVSRTSVRFHFGDVVSRGGISNAIALTRAVSSGELVTSVFSVFRLSAMAEL